MNSSWYRTGFWTLKSVRNQTTSQDFRHFCVMSKIGTLFWFEKQTVIECLKSILAQISNTNCIETGFSPSCLFIPGPWDGALQPDSWRQTSLASQTDGHWHDALHHSRKSHPAKGSCWNVAPGSLLSKLQILIYFQGKERINWMSGIRTKASSDFRHSGFFGLT